ncbi:hypothetical protein LTS18_008483, partial [Coniosporium uncinatum]
KPETRIPSLVPVDEWNGQSFFRNWESNKRSNGWANVVGSANGGSSGYGRGAQGRM